MKWCLSVWLVATETAMLVFPSCPCLPLCWASEARITLHSLWHEEKNRCQVNLLSWWCVGSRKCTWICRFPNCLDSSQGCIATFSIFCSFPSTQSSDMIFLWGRFLIYGSTHHVRDAVGEIDISKQASCRTEIEIKLLLAPEGRAGHTGMESCIRKAWQRRQVTQGDVSQAFASSTHMWVCEMGGGAFVRGYFKTLALPSVVRGSALKLFRLCFALPAAVAWLTTASGTTE